MITYTQAKDIKDLEGILQLQKKNLKIGLSTDEATAQGFVWLKHDLKTLKKFNDIEAHTIAKANEKVIAYVLTMTKKSRYDIRDIFPLFELFDQLKYNGKLISSYNYMLVGQVCVAKDFRGKAVFKNSYLAYKQHCSQNYDFAITEISKSNLRSRNAHKKAGFMEIHEYTDPKNDEWVVVLWDWQK